MMNFKRFFAGLLALCMVLAMMPVTALAAGRPTDLDSKLYIAIYTAGDTFPGEPAEYGTGNYKTINSNFALSNGVVTFASNSSNYLKEQILDDVQEGTSDVWGVFSTTGGSQYLTEASGLVDANGVHNAENEAKIIMAIKGCTEEQAANYTIIWYVIKYQNSDDAWHIDGMIVEKTTYSVNYYGNGNTSGAAPTGTAGLQEGDSYTILDNTGSLVKRDGTDRYTFTGWNTAVDGTGTHYDPGETIAITGDVVLYAEWYLQNKYTATVNLYQDDVSTNYENLLSVAQGMYISLDGKEFTELSKNKTGTYNTTIYTEGDEGPLTYYVYYKDSQGNYLPLINEPTGTHYSVLINDKNGSVDVKYYTVTYDTVGGVWADGEDPGVALCPIGQRVSATENVPYLDGYVFRGWMDQNGVLYQPGGLVTAAIGEKTTLTAY